MTLTNDYTVSVPLALARDPDGPALHLRVDDCAALVEVADHLPWKRIREVTLPAVDDLPAFEAYYGRVRWNLWWNGFDVGRLLDLLPALRRRTVTVLVAPDDPDLYDKMVLGESLSLQMAVPLADPDGIDLATLNSLVSYVLITSATRPVRIEPLVSMINTAADREDQTLWDFAGENVRRNLFVDDAGQVSISARLADTHPYGTLSELESGDFEHTAAFQQLDGYAEGLFRNQSDCATCRAFPLCGSWLRYADPEYDCEVWQLVLTSLQDAVGETERAKALTRQY